MDKEGKNHRENDKKKEIWEVFFSKLSKDDYRDIFFVKEGRRFYNLVDVTGKSIKIDKDILKSIFDNGKTILSDPLIKDVGYINDISNNEKFYLCECKIEEKKIGYILCSLTESNDRFPLNFAISVINGLLSYLEDEKNKKEKIYLKKIEKLSSSIDKLNHKLSVMQQLTNLLHANLEIEEVLDYIAKGVQKALGYGVVLISLLDEKNNVFIRMASAGIEEEKFKQLQKVTPTKESIESLFKEEFRIGTAYFIRHSDGHKSNIEKYIARFSYTVLEEEMLKAKNSWHPEDLFVVPFYGSKGNLLGIMTVDKPYDGLIPDESKVEMMEMFTKTAAMAIEKAKIYTETRRFVKTLEIVNEVSAIITAIMELDKLLKKSVSLIKNRFGYDNVAVMLKRGNYLEMTVYNGYKDVDSKKVNEALKEGKGITTWVMKHVRPVRIDNIAEDKRYVGVVDGPRSEIAVPLKAPMGVVGVLNVEKDGYASLDDYDLKVLTIIGAHLGVAIDNAMRYADTERIAMTDAMTGVYNYRFFITHLEKELNRAKKKGYSVSLLMVDADNFKWYNDTYGHLVGDKVIQQMVELLEDSVRRGDLVTRYGGDEFIVILPGANKEQAVSIAKRIRDKVAKHEFVKDAEKPLTVSVGIATYPEDAEDLFVLLDKADKALYKAKHAGKNTIVECS